MDDELRQYLQAISAQIESQDRKIDALQETQDQKFEALDRKFEALERKTDAIVTLVENVKESLEHEIGTVREGVVRMEVRLGRIAAGSAYVTRLVDWSEKQDVLQLDILRRVQALESRLDKLGA